MLSVTSDCTLIPDRTLTNPYGDHPAKEPLERFIIVLGRELPRNLNPREMQIEVIRQLCRHFGFKPPILSSKIKTFLEFVGIHLEDAPRAHDTTFIWNRVMERYEIKTRTCWLNEWSVDIWHEVSEIIFWRCYHKIGWWKQWAIKNKITQPHNYGDEFAFQLLLSPQSVPAQAKKRGYNVYGVADYYRVPTNLAFRALSSCNNYEHPVLMALLHLNVRPPSTQQTSCQEDLFAEYDVPGEIAHARVWKKFYNHGRVAEDVYGLGVQERHLRSNEEKAFQSLKSYLKTNNILSFEAVDPIYRYNFDKESKEWTVPHILGLDLPTELTVITQRSPHNSNEIFVQIMLPRFKDAFKPKPKSALDLIFWEDQKQFQQAARNVEARTSRRS